MNHSESAGDPIASTAIRKRILQLMDTQPFAVLCLQGDGRPHGALVAYAFSRDLRHMVFVTPVATRKFQLLTESDHVAVVVDNRSEMANALMETEVLTLTGRSKMIQRGGEFTRWAELLVGRHPYLKSFVNDETYALFRVDVARCQHVSRFQEVNQWNPIDHHPV